MNDGDPTSAMRKRQILLLRKLSKKMEQEEKEGIKLCIKYRQKLRL